MSPGHLLKNLDAFYHAILLVLLGQNSDLFVSLPFTVPTLSDQLSSMSPQVWPDLEKAGPDEELHRANSSYCRLWAPYKVELYRNKHP